MRQLWTKFVGIIIYCQMVELVSKWAVQTKCGFMGRP